MGGYPKVWRQHLASEGSARNDVHLVEEITGPAVEWAQRDNQSDRLRTALQRGLCSVQVRKAEEKSLDQFPQYSQQKWLGGAAVIMGGFSRA